MPPAQVSFRSAVYVEDLCVIGLGRTRLAKSVHDAGWASFVGMLEYKAARYGRTFAKIDRFAPTSQACSACGRRDGVNAPRKLTPCGSGKINPRVGQSRLARFSLASSSRRWRVR
jgi:putative transposase